MCTYVEGSAAFVCARSHETRVRPAAVVAVLEWVGRVAPSDTSCSVYNEPLHRSGNFVRDRTASCSGGIPAKDAILLALLVWVVLSPDLRCE
jgi:hypothetical protein